MSGYEITIRVPDKEIASRLVTDLVRSECYESIDGLRIAAVERAEPEPDEFGAVG